MTKQIWRIFKNWIIKQMLKGLQKAHGSFSVDSLISEILEDLENKYNG